MDDGMDPAAFTDIVMQNAGAEAADLQSLIAVMNPTQLATSLQHMALQYRDLQNAATGIWDLTDEDDDRVAGQQPMGHLPMASAPSTGRLTAANPQNPPNTTMRNTRAHTTTSPTPCGTRPLTD